MQLEVLWLNVLLFPEQRIPPSHSAGHARLTIKLMEPVLIETFAVHIKESGW